MAERNDVTPDNLRFLKEPPLRGMSRELVADLWDIVNKRGKVDPNRGMTEFQYHVPNTEITILVSTATGYGGLLVQRDRRIQLGDLVVAETNLIPKIGWDSRLAVRDAKVAVIEIDKELRAAGQIAPDGTRLPISPEESLKREEEKIKVAEIFAEPNVIFATQAVTGEAALRNFDKPEELEVISVQDGIAQIRKKPQDSPSWETIRNFAIIGDSMDLLNLGRLGATKDEIRMANVFIMQTLLKHGQSFWTFGDLPQERKLEVYAEALQKIAEVVGEETVSRWVKSAEELS